MNRNKLEDWPIKKYFLILYQGLRTEVFYWEFINTFRKVLILILNTTFSILPISWRIMITLVLLLAIMRIQIRLDPYKNSENNSIEMKAIIAGMITIYCGLLFLQEGENKVKGFDTISFSLLIIINTAFVLEWFYLFLLSFDFKNDKFRLFLHFYGSMICKKKLLDRSADNTLMQYYTQTNDLSK